MLKVYIHAHICSNKDWINADRNNSAIYIYIFDIL